MKTKKVLTIFVTAFFCIIIASISWAGNSSAKFVPGELVVKMVPGISNDKAKEICTSYGAYIAGEIPQIKVKLIKVPEHALESVKAALENNPNIESVEYNFVAERCVEPNDPRYSSQWYLPRISAPEGWDLNTGSSEIIIAVVDSGVDPSNPEIAIKLVDGYNFDTNNTDTNDVCGHGTAVAGVIAAVTNNEIGVAGIAWESKIMPIRVLGADGSGSYYSINQAIIFAADNGAQIINMSLGGSAYSATMQTAVNYAWDAGVILIASAGNGGSNWPNYPASLRWVMSVSATNSYDDLAGFSSWGSRVDITAPGVGIYMITRNNAYVSWDGTSFSCPMVAGLAGLILSVNPNFTNAQITALIEQNAEDLGDIGRDVYFGNGIIDIYNSLVTAEVTQPYTDITVPIVSIIAPEDDAVVSGNVIVTVSALDDVGVEAVEFYVDGTRHSTVLRVVNPTGPYEFSWTTGLTRRSCVLSAIAYDTSNNIGYSEPITVHVSDTPWDFSPPVINLTSPIDGDLFSKAVIIFATATDNVDVTKMRLFVNGELKIDRATSTIRYRINGRKLDYGPCVVEVEAYDEVGNVARESVTVHKE